MKQSSGIKIWNIRKELSILYFAFTDNRTPLRAKIPALIGVFYLISPIDVIPDFIPFIGYVDDLIIVPLLLNLSIRLLPVQVFESCLNRSIRSNRKMGLVFLIAIVIVVGLLVGLFLLLKKT